MRRLTVLIWLVGAGSGFAAAESVANRVPGNVPLPRVRPAMPAIWVVPVTFREAAGPDFDSDDVTAKPTECDARLEKIATVTLMPRLIGPGACGGGDMVRVEAVVLPDDQRVVLKPAPYLRCPMAEQLALWVRDEAAPRAVGFGAALQTIDTFDDFSCRGRNRQTAGRLSEHGKGNAVDVRGFTLADGRFVGLTDVNAAKEVRESLRGSACARFSTVLGPGSDAFHESHIHLDLIERRNNFRICQWAVLEPPPLPPAKPAAVSAAVAEDAKSADAGQGPAPEAAAEKAPDGKGTRVSVPLPLPRPPVAAAAPSRGRRL